MEITGRLFLCARCQAQVLICSPCDRGQIYCSRECSRLSRQEKMCAAGQRYQRTFKGGLFHAGRSRRYRERQKNVTHQSSLSPPSDDLLALDSALAVATPEASVTAPRCSTMHCHFCDRRLSTFVRIGYLGGRIPRTISQQHHHKGFDYDHSP